MNQGLSLVELVLQASWVVQLIMVLLIGVSLSSWTVIFAKAFSLRQARSSNDAFDQAFWAGRTLQELFKKANETSHPASAQERVFAAGMNEFMKLRDKKVVDATILLNGAMRAMRASYQRELDALETQMDFLGSVASVSPYIGLFGTVWGIMHAFTGLSNLQQVTLATVAPGIAEALVATAVGLFAAIPAVLAYNRFTRNIDRIAVQIETFMEEFSNILARNVLFIRPVIDTAQPL